jgi:phosphatidylethanolamine-binding protein (PEBP) family uncharacterized protein
MYTLRTMNIEYNNKTIKNGLFLKPSETQKQPKIFYKNSNKYYTVLMYDPDAYKLVNNKLVPTTHIHLLIINIKGNDIQTGNIILPYTGPAPPSKTGKHRYIFELYEQPNFNNPQMINERSISNIDKIKRLMNLNLPLYKKFFLSQNENDMIKNGGKRKKTFKREKNKYNFTKKTYFRK